MKDDSGTIIDSLPLGTIKKIFKSQSQFNATPLFLIDYYEGEFLCKIEPVTYRQKIYKGLPDVNEKSIFIVLNNEIEETDRKSVV